jgi:hypothetical protein
MRLRRVVCSAVVPPSLLVPAVSPAIVARPVDLVGPAPVDLTPRCGARVETPGGVGSGAAIPIAALRLGMPVKRGVVSFTTGGGGTAAAADRFRRRQAGLPFAPISFDVAGKALPVVFVPPSNWGMPPPYQRLPLKGASPVIGNEGLVFASATTPTMGRIAALALALPKAPGAKPKLRIVASTQAVPNRCLPQLGVDVFAPAMTAARIHRLFVGSSCSWYALSGCTRAEWPRGQVLFVYRSGGAFIHRWVDYDRLARARFGA